MIPRRLLLPAALAFALLLPAAGDPLAQAAARLRAHAALAGRFTQTARSSLSGRTASEGGRCLIARDGRARFDYDAPAGGAGKLALSDGKTWSLYLPDDRQLVRSALDPAAAPALIFAAPEKLRERFKVETGASPGGGLVISLAPKAPGAPWRSAILELSPEALPRKLTLLDESGSETAWSFDLEPVAPPADALFQFTPPAGTEILGK